MKIYSTYLNNQKSNVVVFSLIMESSDRYGTVETRVIMIAAREVTDKPDAKAEAKTNRATTSSSSFV